VCATGDDWIALILEISTVQKDSHQKSNRIIGAQDTKVICVSGLSMATEPPIGRERLRQVWRASTERHGNFPVVGFLGRQNDSIYCNDFRWKLDGAKADDQDRNMEMRLICDDLVARASEPDRHFDLINEKLSELVICNFESDRSEGDVISRTCQILDRLPKTAPRVDYHNHLWTRSAQTEWPVWYFVRSELESNLTGNMSISTRSPWEQLKVVSLMGTPILNLALQIAIADRSQYNVGWTMQIFLNLTSELLDLAAAPITPGHGLSFQGQYILLAYLWTTWQRSMMLLFYYVLGSQLGSGYDDKWTDKLALRGNSVLGHPSVRATLHGWANQRSHYMCPWAFELLRTSRSSLGLDFRKFHSRFSDAHGDRAARCLFASDQPCDGGHPLECGRFVDKNLVEEEQSMHDLTCSRSCDRLVWDEASYRSISGPTAASIIPNPSAITYCQASENTLAVSHVWSHGQGGRPSTGINRCLHDRYVELAKQYGCDSYWIDTVCIPETHDLRKEAIRYINRIFAESKITLVCDRDLISLDVRRIDESVELLESVLATFLVCDWNVRAWTLLEAIRGNHAIYLLCMFNQAVSLRDALIRVHHEGSIDLAILFLAAQHLLPASTDAFRNSSSRRSVEEAGSLLSHRHATRDSDDIVIWSLLSGIRVFDTAEAMWKSKVNHRIRTGYLMTRTERVQNLRGFSWAPSSPYVRRPSARSGEPPGSHFLAFDGEGSETGIVTAQGLSAVWLVHDVDKDESSIYKDAPATATFQNDDGTHTKTELSGHRIRNHSWQTAIDLLESHAYVRLLQPKSSRSSEPYRAAKDRGETHGPLVAICTSEDEKHWRWNGVYEWSRSVPLPQFDSDEIMLA
jgi:hypothetical protein